MIRRVVSDRQLERVYAPRVQGGLRPDHRLAYVLFLAWWIPTAALLPLGWAVLVTFAGAFIGALSVDAVDERPPVVGVRVRCLVCPETITVPIDGMALCSCGRCFLEHQASAQQRRITELQAQAAARRGASHYVKGPAAEKRPGPRPDPQGGPTHAS